MNTHGAEIIVVYNMGDYSGNYKRVRYIYSRVSTYIRLHCSHAEARPSIRHTIDLPTRKQSFTSHTTQAFHLGREALKGPICTSGGTMVPMVVPCF
jgi:hypothetical protein